MDIPEIFPSEYRFCQILWENEPVSTTKLVALCNERLNWTKSTTYTVIRRLIARGVIRKDSSICVSLVSKKAVQAQIVTRVIIDYFEGNKSEFIKLICENEPKIAEI